MRIAMHSGSSRYILDHRDTFWRTPIHSGAPRCILAHPDDPSDHRDAILDHRDAILDARKPSSDPRKGLRPDLERRKRAPEPILDTPDAVGDQNLDTLDVPEGAPDCIGVIQNVSRCILNHRDDPELHRDDLELHRGDPKDLREGAKPVRDDPETVHEDPGTARDDPELAPDGPRNVRDDPKSDRDDPGMVRDDLQGEPPLAEGPGSGSLPTSESPHNSRRAHARGPLPRK